MQQKTTSNINPKLGLISKIIVAVLTITFIILGIRMVSTLRNDYRYTHTTFSNMEYRLSDQNFSRINEWISDKEAHSDFISGKEKNLGAVGKYYYQAVPYFALKAAGDPRASDYYERMQQFKAQMGEYENQADVIDEIYSVWTDNWIK